MESCNGTYNEGRKRSPVVTEKEPCITHNAKARAHAACCIRTARIRLNIEYCIRANCEYCSVHTVVCVSDRKVYGNKKCVRG